VDPEECEVERWREDVAAYTLASHLYWIVWALVQATVSDIDFDYAEYARMRWVEYHRWDAARTPLPHPAEKAEVEVPLDALVGIGVE
jgi:ethanolamine kinase